MSVLQGWISDGLLEVPVFLFYLLLQLSSNQWLLWITLNHAGRCCREKYGIPLTISYPAKDGMQWQIETGYDPKKTSWSYHHGGILARLVLFLFLIILSNLLTSFSVRQSKFSLLCSILDHNLVNPKNLADI